MGFVVLYMTHERDGPLVYLFAILSTIFILLGMALLTHNHLKRGRSTQADLGAIPTDDIAHALRQHSLNYDLLRRQTRDGFMLASVFMFIGLCIIVCGCAALFGCADGQRTRLRSL